MIHPARLLLVFVWMLLVPLTALAGGGPENVLLLVNQNSEASKTIANHFIELRKIPPNNVLYLDWTGDVEQTNIDLFRTGILQPTLAAIQQRDLQDQIDYVIYSADFPWVVDVHSDVKGTKLPPQLAGLASLNGVTYLWQFVALKSPNVIGMKNNLYVQPPYATTANSRSFGFRSWYGWGIGGQRMEAGGQSYLLSTMLAVTSGRGNTVDEVISYLTRSAAADGTRPRGTIYFMKNGDVRSVTRHGRFTPCVAELQQLGVRAEILDGKIPTDRPDVQGAVVGIANFDWASSGSKILPGAICEHLTSSGGVMRKKADQTPLSEFLRFGAAGASGTVTEPYALQDKFPLPSIQVHYARGCTLAEAFYQSVAGPYQLLIVGDPLCRPWAVIPEIVLDTVASGGLKAGDVVKDEITLKPYATIADGFRVDRYELYVDGRLVDRCAAGESFKLDTRGLADGHHELRIVGIEASPIESQGRLILPIEIANTKAGIELTASTTKVAHGDSLKLTAHSPGATGIAIQHNGHVVARITGEQGEAIIPSEKLGRGPVTLQAMALGGQPVNSKSVRVVVE